MHKSIFLVACIFVAPCAFPDAAAQDYEECFHRDPEEYGHVYWTDTDAGGDSDDLVGRGATDITRLSVIPWNLCLYFRLDLNPPFDAATGTYFYHVLWEHEGTSYVGAADITWINGAPGAPEPSNREDSSGEAYWHNDALFFVWNDTSQVDPPRYGDEIGGFKAIVGQTNVVTGSTEYHDELISDKPWVWPERIAPPTLSTAPVGQDAPAHLWIPVLAVALVMLARRRHTL